MKNNDTLFEMLAGIIIWGLLVQIVLFIGFKDYLYNAIGLWCGIIVSVGWTIDLKHSIDEIIYLAGEFAEREYKSGAAKRMGIAALVIGFVFYKGWGNPITVLAGIFSVKISAYTQPYMHKLFQKIKKTK